MRRRSIKKLRSRIRPRSRGRGRSRCRTTLTPPTQFSSTRVTKGTAITWKEACGRAASVTASLPKRRRRSKPTSRRERVSPKEGVAYGEASIGQLRSDGSSDCLDFAVHGRRAGASGRRESRWNKSDDPDRREESDRQTMNRDQT